jgi:hypothetical protein
VGMTLLGVYWEQAIGVGVCVGVGATVKSIQLRSIGATSKTTFRMWLPAVRLSVGPVMVAWEDQEPVGATEIVPVTCVPSSSKWRLVLVDKPFCDPERGDVSSCYRDVQVIRQPLSVCRLAYGRVVCGSFDVHVISSEGVEMPPIIWAHSCPLKLRPSSGVDWIVCEPRADASSLAVDLRPTADGASWDLYPSA